jgi:hypothetical protein
VSTKTSGFLVIYLKGATLTDSISHGLPETYVQFLKELDVLSLEPFVSNLALDLGLPAEYLEEPIDSTWIHLGCSSIEQDSKTGESTLWHTYSDGPYGDPNNPEFFEGVVSIGGWNTEDFHTHYLEHGIDTFTWSLLNSLTQVVNDSLQPEHDDRTCAGINEDLAKLLQGLLIEKLKPLEVIDCECGTFAKAEVQDLK